MEFDEDGNPCKWRERKEFSITGELCLVSLRRDPKITNRSAMAHHVKINFDGTEKASIKPYIDQCESIDGPALKLTDAQHLCASARFCHRAGGTWEMRRNQIPDDPEAKKIAIEEAGDCPSGSVCSWD